MATLFVVATPIGNLSDFTFRAIETLKEVSLIVCEDTRHSRRLLDHYGISKPLKSGHGHNEQQSATAVVLTLAEGKDVAYLSDAGTPGISDPGRVITRAVREAGYPVVPIPGPSALSAILSVNGFPGKAVTFEGFLSPKSGKRRKRLAELLDQGDSFVLFESPHRVLKLLADLTDLNSVRRVLLGRELTKVHEEVIEGTAQELLARMEEKPSIKGEFVILVGPPEKGVI
jgi:16S rRNA (cytidine1402-2'-O)-methyltransferase